MIGQNLMLGDKMSFIFQVYASQQFHITQLADCLLVSFIIIFIFKTYFTDVVSTIYLTDVKLMLRIFFSISSTVTIKTSSLPLKSRQLNSFGIYKKIVHRNTIKLSIDGSSSTLKLYRQDAIFGNLHREKRISSNFEVEVSYIKQ